MAELTGDQQAAVASRGTTFVSAGAGTGKTTVLVERVAQAVEGGLEPERILVVTYTERAAQQLMSRVRTRLTSVSDELGRLAERVEISTIHGFCARILRQHAFAAGIDPEFRVLEEAQRLDPGRRGLRAGPASGGRRRARRGPRPARGLRRGQAPRDAREGARPAPLGRALAGARAAAAGEPRRRARGRPRRLRARRAALPRRRLGARRAGPRHRPPLPGAARRAARGSHLPGRPVRREAAPTAGPRWRPTRRPARRSRQRRSTTSPSASTAG